MPIWSRSCQWQWQAVIVCLIIHLSNTQTQYFSTAHSTHLLSLTCNHVQHIMLQLNILPVARLVLAMQGFLDWNLVIYPACPLSVCCLDGLLLLLITNLCLPLFVCYPEQFYFLVCCLKSIKDIENLYCGVAAIGFKHTHYRTFWTVHLFILNWVAVKVRVASSISGNWQHHIQVLAAGSS